MNLITHLLGAIGFTTFAAAIPVNVVLGDSAGLATVAVCFASAGLYFLLQDISEARKARARTNRHLDKWVRKHAK